MLGAQLNHGVRGNERHEHGNHDDLVTGVKIELLDPAEIVEDHRRTTDLLLQFPACGGHRGFAVVDLAVDAFPGAAAGLVARAAEQQHFQRIAATAHDIDVDVSDAGVCHASCVMGHASCVVRSC